jgi:low affinity Fe/Cu permease
MTSKMSKDGVAKKHLEFPCKMLAKKSIIRTVQDEHEETLEKIFDKYADAAKRWHLFFSPMVSEKAASIKTMVEKLIATFLTKLKPRLKKWESRWFPQVL